LGRFGHRDVNEALTAIVLSSGIASLGRLSSLESVMSAALDPACPRPPKPRRARAWLWGAIELVALWRARARLKSHF